MKRALYVLIGCVTLLPARAVARHSAAAFDTQEEVTVRGVVDQYKFANPHIYVTLQVTKDDGAKTLMEVEAGAASVLNGLGFTKTSLAIGEVVTVVGNPARKDPDKLMLGKDLYKQDGSYVPLNIASRSIYDTSMKATATSIAGTWFSPRTEFNAFLGSGRNWPLTEKGRAAATAKFDPAATTQKDCIPIGAPGLMF